MTAQTTGAKVTYLETPPAVSTWTMFFPALLPVQPCSFALELHLNSLVPELDVTGLSGQQSGRTPVSPSDNSWFLSEHPHVEA